MTKKETQSRIAVVTGGNRGLGLETCRQLGRLGLHVILAARDEAKGKQVAHQLADEGLPVTFHALDVSDSASIDKFAHEMETRYGRVDVLINNAGIMIDLNRDTDEWTMSESTVFKAKRETLRQTMETNVYGPLELTQKLVPLMRKHGYGRIVNLSSGMGQLSDMGGGWPAYRISKTAINAVTRIFSSELQGPGFWSIRSVPAGSRPIWGARARSFRPKKESRPSFGLQPFLKMDPRDSFLMKIRIRWTGKVHRILTDFIELLRYRSVRCSPQELEIEQ